MAELRALTGARGIAAWGVVFFHLRHSLIGVPAPVMAVLDKGYLAVDFFFLLSGFVMWMTWHARFEADGSAAIGPFLHRRVARILPLHLLVLTGAVLLALALGMSGRNVADQFPWDALPLHVMLMQTWGSADTLTWNDPAWTISAEFGAYLTFPLIATHLWWHRRSSGQLVIGALALVALMAAVMAWRGQRVLGDNIPCFGLLRCLIEFAVGTIVAALWLRWRDRPGVGIAATVLGVAALTLWIGGVMRETVAVPVAFAALLLALALSAGRRGNVLERPLVHWLGQVSYATYLSHYLLWFVFKLLFVRDASAAPWSVVFAYLACVVVVSAILYRWCERPAQRFVNGLARDRMRPQRIG